MFATTTPGPMWVSRWPTSLIGCAAARPRHQSSCCELALRAEHFARLPASQGRVVLRVLVTGGAGFIGYHVVERILSDRHAVCVLDELNDFYSPALKARNLEDLRRLSPIEFRQFDICDQTLVFELFQQFEPEIVIHLAARAGVRASLEFPLLYIESNVKGTAVLLEASVKYGVRKFVFASSSSVYGVTNTVPFSETESALRPASPYAATKLAADSFATYILICTGFL